MGFGYGGQQVADGACPGSALMEGRGGVFPRWFLTAFVSLSLWPCRLSLSVTCVCYRVCVP